MKNQEHEDAAKATIEAATNAATLLAATAMPMACVADASATGIRRSRTHLGECSRYRRFGLHKASPFAAEGTDRLGQN